MGSSILLSAISSSGNIVSSDIKGGRGLVPVPTVLLTSTMAIRVQFLVLLAIFSIVCVATAVGEMPEMRIVEAKRGTKLGVVLGKKDVVFCPTDFTDEEIGFTVRCNLKPPVTFFVNGVRTMKQKGKLALLKGNRKGWKRPWRDYPESAWIVCMSRANKRGAKVIQGNIIFRCDERIDSMQANETSSTVAAEDAAQDGSEDTDFSGGKEDEDLETGAFEGSSMDEEVSTSRGDAETDASQDASSASYISEVSSYKQTPEATPEESPESSSFPL